CCQITLVPGHFGASLISKNKTLRMAPRSCRFERRNQKKMNVRLAGTVAALMLAAFFAPRVRADEPNLQAEVDALRAEVAALREAVQQLRDQRGAVAISAAAAAGPANDAAPPAAVADRQQAIMAAPAIRNNDLGGTNLWG